MAAPYHGWYVLSTVVTALRDQLASMGFEDGQGANCEPTPEMVHAARRLSNSGRRVVGLLPATRNVAVIPLAIRLAVASVYLGVERVVVVDANTRLPAFRATVASSEYARELGSEELLPGVFVRRLDGPPLHGLDLALLNRTLKQERNLAGLVLVDLTGFSDLGEHLRAFEMTDGALIVAVAGQTPKSAVEACGRALPGDLNLGVFLIG